MASGSLAFEGATQRLGPLAAKGAIVALALAAVPVLYTQPLWTFVAILALVITLAMVIDRTLVIPILIVAIPLEISKEYLPSIYDDPSTVTIHESILDAGRLAFLVAAVLWVTRARSTWYRELPQSGLYLPIVVLAGLFALSAAYGEDPQGGVRSFLRLVSNLGLFTVVLLYVRDRTTLDRSLLAIVGIGLVLALMGLYQQATDTYFFNEALAERFDSPRRNATFFDPNIYARFLVVVSALALGMLASARPRWRYLLIGTVVTALLALVFTSSRSNWIAAALVLPLVVLMLPISGRDRLRTLALGAAAGITLVGIVTAAEPALADRITSAASDLEGRSYLVRAGWQMFLDHPLFGVGLDGYTDALQGPYSDFLAGSTLTSHTSVITVMSELGILGLMVLGLLLYRFGQLSWRLYSGASRGDRALVAGLAGAFLVIFVSSQSEGRLFEEPYLWLVLGLTVALAGIRQREAQNDMRESPQ